ncbi:T9SS type A sorting domain-containing protein [Candidatus Cloacimonadota bacterium]
MNILKSFIFIACFVIFTGNAFAHVALDYPAGGEIFQGNEVAEIQWHVVVPHGPANWDLFYSWDGGGNWEEIALDLPVTQLSYEWTIPNIDTETGRIRVVQDNESGLDYSDDSADFTIVMTTGANKTFEAANTIILLSAHPNPFNPTTSISYTLTRSSNVVLKVYNLLGQEIRTLVNETQTAGRRVVVWDGRNHFGKQVGSGVYFYQIQADDFLYSHKIMLLQ